MLVNLRLKGESSVVTFLLSFAHEKGKRMMAIFNLCICAFSYVFCIFPSAEFTGADRFQY